MRLLCSTAFGFCLGYGVIGQANPWLIGAVCVLYVRVLVADFRPRKKTEA